MNPSRSTARQHRSRRLDRGRRRLRHWAEALIALGVIAVPGRAVAQEVVVLTGQVIAEGEPVPAAAIVATGPNGAARAAVTDSDGRFRMSVAASTRSLSLRVRAIGYQPLEETVARPDDASRLWFVRLTLEIAPIPLDGVQAVAGRPTPFRSVNRPPGEATEGADERTADGVVAGVAPEAQGDLDALASTIPGVLTTPDGGISILGQSPGATAVTLGGLSFEGDRLPAGARLMTSVAVAPYDPSRGGFTGGEIAVNLVPGSAFIARAAHLVALPGALQVAGPALASAGEPPTEIQAGLSGRGPLTPRGPYYSGAVQARRSAAETESLLGAGSDLLRELRVSPDSLARFADLLTRLGVRPGAAAVAERRQGLTLLGGIQFFPPERGLSGTASGVTAYADLARVDGWGMAPSALATTAMSGSSGTVMLMGNVSTFLGGIVLTDSRGAVTRHWSRARPALELPSGVLRFPASDGGGSPAPLGFGGSASVPASVDRSLADASTRLTWFDTSGKHRFQVFAHGRYATLSREDVANALGTFVYSSLADLEQNRPSAYRRSLGRAPVEAGQVDGAAAVSDSWRVTDNLSLLLGLRLEANRFSNRPAENERARALFGLDTRRLPEAWHVSPRLGFTWLTPVAKKSDDRFVDGVFGTYLRGPSGVLRGGIGEFRERLPIELAAAAVAGESAGGRLLRCVGPAVPEADWSGFTHGGAPVPHACAPGAEPLWAHEAPEVVAFSPAFRPERAVRATLGWDGRLGDFFYGIEGVYSLGIDRRSTADLNLVFEPTFHLADEGLRPVFAAATAIDSATGAIAAAASRVHPAFGRVVEQRSDGASTASQLRLTLTRYFSPRFVRASYVLSDVRERAPGFEAGTDGDPRRAEWAAGPFDVRHAFQVEAATALGRIGESTRFALSGFASVRSGRPFTPLVGGDINGDGLSNDRAFIFDAAHVSDLALDRLTEGARDGVRECLLRQVGRVAARGSCRGPWTASASVRLDVRRVDGPLARSTLSLTMSNIPAGLDRLLHGGRPVGWGSAAEIDNVLYAVRGFDPAGGRFEYAVNPGFGRLRPGSLPAGSGFRITLAAQVNLGPSIPNQQLDRWGPTRKGGSLSVDSLRALYESRIPDPYLTLLLLADSVRLDSAQAEPLRTARRAYRNEIGALADALARDFAASPSDAPRESLLSRQTAFTDSAYAALWRQGPLIRGVLSPFQYHLAPKWLRALLDAPKPPKEGELVVP
jgi:hypothetical protein